MAFVPGDWKNTRGWCLPIPPSPTGEVYRQEEAGLRREKKKALIWEWPALQCLRGQQMHKHFLWICGPHRRDSWLETLPKKGYPGAMTPMVSPQWMRELVPRSADTVPAPQELQLGDTLLPSPMMRVSKHLQTTQERKKWVQNLCQSQRKPKQGPSVQARSGLLCPTLYFT